MHFALNSFFRPIFGLHRKRMWTLLKPNFHTIDTRYKLLVIDLIFIATIDKKSLAMALLANVSTRWEPVENEQPEMMKCELLLGTGPFSHLCDQHDRWRVIFISQFSVSLWSFVRSAVVAVISNPTLTDFFFLISNWDQLWDPTPPDSPWWTVPF